MINNILNLEGVAILGKSQQESISGGQFCTITKIKGGISTVARSGGYAPGEAGSADANDYCVWLIEDRGYDRCFYDCEWDDDMA